MRVFTAVELPERIKEKVDHECRILRIGRASIRWVEKRNLHITVAFIGDIEKEKIPIIGDAISNTVKGLSPIDLIIEEPGFLPSQGKPRVVIFTLGGERGRFSQLCARIYENLSKLELALERNNTVHLTLGRIKRPFKISGKEIFEGKFESLALNIPVGVSRVALFESKLFRKGPVYKRIMTFEL